MAYFVVTIEDGTTQLVEALDIQEAVMKTPTGLSARVALGRDLEIHASEEEKEKGQLNA